MYNGFAIARDGEHALQPEDIDPFLCTHIVFSFAEVDETGTRLKDPDHFEANYLYDVILWRNQIKIKYKIKHQDFKHDMNKMENMYDFKNFYA